MLQNIAIKWRHKIIRICGQKLTKIWGSHWSSYSCYDPLHYLSIYFLLRLAWLGFTEIKTVTKMDTVISSSASASFTRSLPAVVPVRTIATSISVSASLPLPRSRWSPRQRLYSNKRRFQNSSSSAVPQFTVTCGAGITEISESQFNDTVLKANRPVLVEFVATWCGPCRLIAPAMQSLAQVTSI